MKTELVKKIHEQKYSVTMTFDQYLGSLMRGLELMQNQGLYQKDIAGMESVNLALEYNMELMVNYLS